VCTVKRLTFFNAYFLFTASNGITNGISEKDISLGPKSPAVAGDVGADDEMFDDMDDDLFGIPETEGGDDDDDDENEISISKIKAEVGFIGDEYVGVDRATKRRKKLDDDDDDRSSVASIDGNNSVRSSRQTMMLNPFTEAQKPFQPSSTPIHLEHRFLVSLDLAPIPGKLAFAAEIRFVVMPLFPILILIWTISGME